MGSGGKIIMVDDIVLEHGGGGFDNMERDLKKFFHDY